MLNFVRQSLVCILMIFNVRANHDYQKAVGYTYHGALPGSWDAGAVMLCCESLHDGIVELSCRGRCQNNKL